MSIEEIRALLRLAELSGIQALEFGSAEAGLRAVWSSEGGAAAQALPPVDKPQRAAIAASVPGRFTPTHPMARRDAAAEIAAGETLGFLRVGACLTRIVAPSDGRYRAMVEEGALVGYGDVIFAPA